MQNLHKSISQEDFACATMMKTTTTTTKDDDDDARVMPVSMQIKSHWQHQIYISALLLFAILRMVYSYYNFQWYSN